MFQNTRRILVAVGCLFALLAASPVRAGEHAAPAKADRRPSFHRQADLAKWLRKNMIPGHTRPQDVFAVFGTNYYHPFERVDENNNRVHDISTLVFSLDRMGVHDHGCFDALFVHFDQESGNLLSAGIEEVEHQTGFHLEPVTGE